MRLSVIIPVYNEARYLKKIVEQVIAQPVPGIVAKEIVIVNDGSTDETADEIAKIRNQFPEMIIVKNHKQNSGKGAAIQTAQQCITGELCIIQDADLEYSPTDYPLILEPMISGRADCVFGSRFTGAQSKRVLYFWHYMGNKFLTLLSNMCTNLNLTDMEAGYKAFRADLFKSITIQSRDFGFEPEIAAKVARRKCRVYEVGISYSGRTYQEGKKIGWKDGFKAIGVILKYRLV